MNVLIFALFLSMSIQMQPSTRKLLVFGKAQPQHKEQVALLKNDSSGMAERDLILIMVEDEQMYKKYNVVVNQFAVLLIGKDGGEKLRSAKPLRPEIIFQLIDSMPMRQTEMGRKKN